MPIETGGFRKFAASANPPRIHRGSGHSARITPPDPARPA